MINTRWDLILVGAGLANGLIAWRLRQCQPALNVLLIEAGPTPGGNHTWSFHHGDISAAQHAWLDPLVAHRWADYDVFFPERTRTVAGGYTSVTSERFAEVISRALGDHLVTQTPISRLTPTSVALEDGRILEAGAVIDGRGYQPSPHLTVGLQAFLGQQWQLKHPHGLTRPRLMDATVDQQGGYRFVYTLPLSATSLLIEDTHYIDRATLDHDRARLNIAYYAKAQDWALGTLQREGAGQPADHPDGQPRGILAGGPGSATKRPTRRPVSPHDRLFASAGSVACRYDRRAILFYAGIAVSPYSRLRGAVLAAAALFSHAQPHAVSGRP
ncbi:hypothetical protein HSBAA_53260 [Vreelandella sulfidaeris]|uniref:Lycopene cyclase n=1 Tax=Vreelandella sulfidaeris TaxID=115553 RepID=A0A455UCR2_9GAMM|nr:hypothetical protein HSBAA_53260 [Halomonas sulfidaeris]